ncbi:uncharacterized protein MONBRDRAFT_29620 [Monosiga brevicollis MX1]|uniref:Opine dehydrogenase domain-containing protein n=1 Tax=Monosiga brevicollis TaxID=81824 RepID=A9VBM6_MONBE|nr:uncharacterized protein MONBRDRAFT_29620 [Monosiga brevicollis MX1]EDQ85124.1 predicted protein [Monosiga brevicollis MX1]|eukprot:XP_001750128.1 hypothetical protein [Monosiga brevicollis MX1]
MGIFAIKQLTKSFPMHVPTIDLHHAHGTLSELNTESRHAAYSSKLTIAVNCQYHGVQVISKLPTFAQPKTLLARPLMWALQWNKRLSEVKAPMVPEGSGFVPNVTSRFFTDDTAHGLCVLQGMAEILDVEMPRVLFLLRRLQHIMGKQYVSELPDARGRFLNGADVPETSAPQAYGVHSLPELLQFLTWNRDEDVVVGSHFLRLEPEYQPNTVEVVQARL